MNIQELPPLSNKRLVLPEIASVSLRDKVIACLKEAIFSGALQPGDPIVERQMAQQMKIGTPAIREALVSLAEQGFVRRVANTATYVNSYSTDEVKELYQLRVEFELLALRWAERRGVTEADLHGLERLVERMAEAAQAQEVRGFYELDMAFHRRCWSLSGNRFLVRSLEALVPPLFAFVLMASGATVSEAVAYEHRTIINALRRLDEPDFSNAVRETLSGFAMAGIASLASQDRDR